MGELLANRLDRDWIRASVTDYRFKPRAADLYTKERKKEKKKKEKGKNGENLKQYVHACMPRCFTEYRVALMYTLSYSQDWV